MPAKADKPGKRETDCLGAVMQCGAACTWSQCSLVVFVSSAQSVGTSGTGACLWKYGTGTARPGTTSWERCHSE